ncbi:hypothetical protein [Serratia marcescens]|uniref:hypothetical protein n=1 Tax=Serratia TaxID=613 RepID=UPI0029E792EA|nr:hypothetical protein [Serratia marcescens]
MEDYASAAIRHYIDAEKLKSSGSIDNAGHLVGFAAECALKYKISTISPDMDRPRGHFPDFVNIAKKRLNSRAHMSVFKLLSNPILAGWDVNYRYYVDGTVNSAVLDSWIRDTVRLISAAGLKVRK